MEESNADCFWRKLKYGLTDSQNTWFLMEAKNNLRIWELMEELEDKEPESLFKSFFLELEGDLFFNFWCLFLVLIWTLT
jgi:hypothetical protein